MTSCYIQFQFNNLNGYIYLGWKMERNQTPNSLHLSILPSHIPVVDDLLTDLKAATERVKVSLSVSDVGDMCHFTRCSVLLFEVIKTEWLDDMIML